VNLKSSCKKWVCCSRDQAFSACNFDRDLARMCKGKKKMYKAQCVQVKRGVLLFGPP